MPDFAPGLPDPKRFGDVTTLPTGKELPFVIQRHLAERAGPHYDIRFGPDDMFSWATKKELPKPGEKRMIFQQPLHRGQYASFEGEITRGYGKGTVKTHDKGSIIVEEASPKKIKFTVTHRKFPENYTLIRVGGPPRDPKSSRERSTQGGSWLMVNTTPTDAVKMLGGDPEDVGLQKARYVKIPAEKVDKVFDPNYLVQEKIDGASALYHVLADRINVLSYRTSKEGRPIVHTYRVFGPNGSKTTTKIPKELVGTILKGEIYGEREGKAIPAQELGGILNASVRRSLEKQREQKVRMRNMLFDVVRLGKGDGAPMGAEERMQKLREIAAHLPKGMFRLPETAKTPDEARELYRRIVSGEHPLTSEGIVAWPKEPGKPPLKVKPRPESDVWVKGVFPGEGKLKGVGAGGFEYANAPEGDVVGRVGTGFSEQTRREMMEDPEAWIGRMARVTAQDRFPGGALRAPSFMALHEDYPLKEATVNAIKTAAVKKIAWLTKAAIPKRLVDAVRARAVKNLQQRKEFGPGGVRHDPERFDAINQDYARSLALLNRVAAGKAGMRLSQGGQELGPGGKITQTFLRSKGKPIGFESTFTVDKSQGGVEPAYVLDHVQGFGRTRGRPLSTFETMRGEIEGLHTRAGLPNMKAGLTPGRQMPNPEAYDVSIEGGRDWGKGLGGGRLVHSLNLNRHNELGTMDALRFWPKERYGMTHIVSSNPDYVPGMGNTPTSVSVITPEMRKYLLTGPEDFSGILAMNAPLKTASFNKFASSIKQAIPRRLVQAVRDRAVKRLQEISKMKPVVAVHEGLYDDYARSLALLTRVRAGEAGMRLSSGGQKLEPGGRISQLFLRAGDKPTGFHAMYAVSPKGKEPLYMLDHFQGYGRTRGRPLSTFVKTKGELADIHARAGLSDVRAELTPGRSMTNPEAFSPKIEGGRDWGKGLGGGKLIPNLDEVKDAYLPKMDALRVWPHLRYGMTHMKFRNPDYRAGSGEPLYSFHEIPPSVREAMLAGMNQPFPGKLTTYGGPSVSLDKLREIMARTALA